MNGISLFYQSLIQSLSFVTHMTSLYALNQLLLRHSLTQVTLFFHHNLSITVGGIIVTYVLSPLISVFKSNWSS